MHQEQFPLQASLQFCGEFLGLWVKVTQMA